MKKPNYIKEIFRKIKNLISNCMTFFLSLFPYILKKFLAFLFPNYNKEHRKIASQARKDLIINRVIPYLQEFGFYKPSIIGNYGWNPAMPGYSYELVKLQGNELQILRLDSYLDYSKIIIYIYICKISPLLSSLEQLNEKRTIGDFSQNDMIDLRDMYPFSYPFKLKVRWKNRRYLEWKKNRLAKKIIKFLSSDKPIKYWNKHRYTETLDWNGNVVVAAPPEYRQHKRWINQPYHTDSSNM